jgi:hypothetical protein
MPDDQVNVPSTLRRSSAEVRRTYEKTLASGEEQYGNEERAHRAAWGSVNNVGEKKADHSELKGETGASDPRSMKLAAQKRRGEGETYGGVDVQGNTRGGLVQRAKDEGVRGYSTLPKAELGRALQCKQHDSMPPAGSPKNRIEQYHSSCSSPGSSSPACFRSWRTSSCAAAAAPSAKPPAEQTNAPSLRSRPDVTSRSKFAASRHR